MTLFPSFQVIDSSCCTVAAHGVWSAGLDLATFSVPMQFHSY
jgi:hypothetical protein